MVVNNIMGGREGGREAWEVRWVDGRDLHVALTPTGRLTDTQVYLQPMRKYGFLRRPMIGVESDKKPHRIFKAQGKDISPVITLCCAGVAPKVSTM